VGLDQVAQPMHTSVPEPRMPLSGDPALSSAPVRHTTPPVHALAGPQLADTSGDGELDAQHLDALLDEPVTSWRHAAHPSVRADLGEEAVELAPA
jgi:hypothetical protein